MDAEKNTQFNYLLNAFERASQADRPVDHGYRQKREALIEHVRELERIAQLVVAVHVGPGRIYDFDKLTGAIVAARALGVMGSDVPLEQRPDYCAGFVAGQRYAESHLGVPPPHEAQQEGGA